MTSVSFHAPAQLYPPPPPQGFIVHHPRTCSIIEYVKGHGFISFVKYIYIYIILVIITDCVILHNIYLRAGDIVAKEDEPEDDVGEDEEQNGLEVVSVAPWPDQLSPELSVINWPPPF